MGLLTPTERMTLEAIRDLGHTLPGHVEWATEKGGMPSLAVGVGSSD
jgi:hypothetical protein